jgi:putative hydrolase of the HAD superfamily
LINTVIFDFFGTLVHYDREHIVSNHDGTMSLLQTLGFRGSFEDFSRSWRSCFESKITETAKTLNEFHMYDVTREFFSLAELHAGEADVASFVDSYLSEWNEKVSYLAGIQLFIDKLANNFRLALISNTHYGPLVLKHLDAMGIRSYFEIIVTSVEYGIKKPHPAIFEHTLRALKINSDEAIYIGDSYRDDYCGATNAGIRCLLIDPLNQEQQVRSEDRIVSVFDLEQALTAL